MILRLSQNPKGNDVANRTAKVDNIIDPKLKKTFIEMRDHYQVLNERANGAAAKRRQYLKEVKEAGYSLQQIKISVMLQTPEGEAEFKAEMANRLLAAAYSDADIGDQLSLFLDHNRTPAVDRAYKEGQSSAMKNEAAAPKYDPDTEQYRAYMEGYHDEQARQVRGGIGKLDAKAEAAKGGRKGRGKGKAAAAKPAGKRGRPAKADKGGAKPDAAPPRRPTARPVTRSTLAAQKVAAPANGAEPDSFFTKSTKAAGTA